MEQEEVRRMYQTIGFLVAKARNLSEKNTPEAKAQLEIVKQTLEMLTCEAMH